MRYSILFLNEEAEGNPDLIYDLSIDRFIANISADKRKNDYFCRLLSQPLTSVDNIEYRREILNDLELQDGLFTAVKTLFNRYDRIKSDWLEMKAGTASSVGDKGSEAMLDYIYSSLKVTAMFPKTILSFFVSIYDTLSSFGIKSRGLCALRDYIKELIDNKYLKEIVDIGSQFMYNNYGDYDFKLALKVADDLTTADAQIVAVAKREKKRTNILSLLAKKKTAEGVCEDSSHASMDTAQQLLGEALYVIDKQLEAVTDGVYGALYGISRELDFYEVALSYLKFLKETGKPYCYPVMGCEDVRCKALCDLLLLSEAKTEVFSNDVDFNGSRGVLIRGKNNTGKTTFLRSVVTAQFFAQAGLPIAAEEAALPLYGKLFTHFSSAEEEFERGDSSGRFESEVKAIAAIVDQIDNSSLVVLNETFQTTAYDEGAVAIADILDVMVKVGCRFIFVTHLTALFDMSGDYVLKLESADGDSPFTIKKIKEIRK